MLKKAENTSQLLTYRTFITVFFLKCQQKYGSSKTTTVGATK